MTNCAVRGMIPPWGSRDENSLHTYTPADYDPFVPPPAAANSRNIARLNTHAVVVTEGSYEFEVFYYPHNHDWDIAQSEFTDGHDGVYLSGRNIRFHHNWVDGFQDDAIYLSAPSPSFNDNIRVYENLITRAYAFSCTARRSRRTTICNIADPPRRVCQPSSPKNPRERVQLPHLPHTWPRLSGHRIDLLLPKHFISPSSGGGYAHRTLTSTSRPTQRRGLATSSFISKATFRSRIGRHCTTSRSTATCTGRLFPVRNAERFLKKCV
jgi:hypothetical protein